MSGGMETRRSPRVPIRLSAEFEHAGRLLTAMTRNLSVGGVCLECELPVVEGEALRVGLFLVFDDVEDAIKPPLVVRSRVAWSSVGEDGAPSLMGVRFEGLSAPQSAELQKFLGLISA